MPIKVEAVTKDEFQRWLEDAKKKYAHHDDRSDAVRVAAASDATGAARPAPAGN
jgi:heme/copper-type cytochrome/quinol oxidase subunit 2